MRRLSHVLVALLCLSLLVWAPAADAGKPKHKKRSGVAGVVRNATCYGACAEPPPPQPVYTGTVTVTVARAGDGVQVVSAVVSDGHFRFRLKRGAYDLSSVPATPPSCQPP